MNSARFIFTHISRIPYFVFQLLNYTIFSWKKLSAKNRYLLLVGVFASFLVLIPIALSTLFNSDKAEAAWWNDSWGYRQSIDITNASGSNQSDIQVKILSNADLSTLISAGKLQADLDDLRFTDNNGKIIKYWIEDSASSSADVWGVIPSVPTSGTYIYMYYGNSSALSASNVVNVKQAGGAITTVSGYRIHTFTGNGIFSTTEDIIAETLVIAGGGGGGSSAFSSGGGGGGGAGGLNYNATTSINNGLFTVVVGTGGPPGTAGSNQYGTNGGDSSFNGIAVTGGGGGAKTGVNGKDGGSGGGGGYNGYSVVRYGGNPVAGQGSAGGNTSLLAWAGGAGGGGAGGIGGDNKINHAGGDRGAGLAYSISGSSVTYARGGGGGANSPAASTPNTGNGGDAAYSNGTAYAGADGIVIIRYAAITTVTAGSPTNEEKSQGPVAYWKFDEGTGTATKDAASKNHNASLASGTSWATEDMCVSGKCLKFDGVDDYVSMGTGTNYFPMDTFSICNWIKTPGLASGMSLNGIISLTYGLTMWLDSNGALVSRLDNGTTFSTITATGNLADNKWHYVCTTYDGTYQRLYSDGIEKISAARTWLGTTRWPTNAVNVGHENNNPAIYKFNGLIDETKIYNYARSAAQIKLDYTSRGSVKGASSSIGNDLVRQGSLANGLVGYWKQDEATWSGTLSEVVDSSGNGNHGQAQGATDAKAYPTTGKFGNGGYFDGVDDYVQIGDSNSLDVSSEATFAVWVNSNSFASHTNVFQKVNTDSDASYMLYEGTSVEYSGPTFRPHIRTSSGWRYGAINFNPTTGAWYHVVYTYKASTGEMKAYINGQPYAITFSSAPVAGETIRTGNAPLLIGKDTRGINYFNGKMDELRIYNRALSPAEVSALYNYAPGPYVYLSFDDGSGSTITDKSGNGYSGTWNGSGSHWKPGKYGKAAYFNGSSDYVSFSSLPNPSTNGPITIEMWANPTSSSPVGMFDSAPSTTNVLRNYPAGNVEWWNSNPAVTLGLTANTWTHIAFVFDFTSGSRVVKYYRNGVLIGTSTGTTPTWAWTTFRLGNINGGSAGWYSGSLDEFRVYNYARTAGQIVEDMNAGHPIGGSPIGSQVGYWKFDEGYGTTAKDSGPNKIHETSFVGTPTWTNDGKFGKALHFDGQDAAGDYVKIPYSSSLNIFAGTTWSVSMWVKPTTGGVSAYAVLNGTSHKPRLVVNTTTASIEGFVGGNFTSILGASGITVNQWNHVVFMGDGTNNKIFINGKQKGSAAYQQLDSPPGEFHIGASGWSSENFQGGIDEVKFYNTALTAEQVKLDMNQGKSLVLGSFGTDSDGKTASNSASRIYCVPGDTSTCNPPVAEWNFEEGQGSTVNDTSGNGNDGIWSGLGNHWTSGKIGKAGNFTGNTAKDYVYKIPSQTVSNNFTVSVWVKPTSTQNMTVFSTRLPNEYTFDLQLNGGTTIHGDIGNGSSWITASANATYNYPLNKWTHITYTVTTTGYKIYVNGQQMASNSYAIASPLLFDLNHRIQIGSHYSGTGSTYYFQGKMDQVRIYDYARTPAQIAWDYNRGAPVAHWKFDECQGGTAYDSSGNGNTGTITIGATGTQTSAGTCQTSGTAWGNGITGKFNSSLNFDGTDDYINAGNSSSLNISNALSVGGWVKFNVANDKSTIVSKWGRSTSSNFSWLLFANWWQDGRIDFLVSGNGTSYVGVNSGVGIINSGEWMHVMGIYDGSSIKLYINGTLRNTVSASVPTSLKTVSTPVSIGIDYDTGTGDNPYRHFDGQMDDVRIYNYALTPLQVKNVMNQGAAVRWGPNAGQP
jgi:hypothetical protein